MPFSDFPVTVKAGDTVFFLKFATREITKLRGKTDLSTIARDNTGIYCAEDLCKSQAA